MAGECVSSTETMAGWEGKVLARTLENWDGEENGDSQGRKRGPSEWEMVVNQSRPSSFAKCSPFCWLMLTELWLDNNSTSLRDTSLYHSNDVHDCQAYDSMLLICFSILVKI